MKINFSILFLLLFFTFSFSNNRLSIKASIKTAKHLEKKGDIDGAIAIYTSVLNQNPNHNLSEERLKFLFMNHQRYDEAINFLKERIKQSFNKYKIYPELGEFYYLNNQKVDAKNVWNNGLDIFKNNRSIYRLMISKYTKLGLDDELEEVLKSGREKFGKSFLAYESGVYYQARRTYDKAMDQYILYLLYEPKQMGIIERRILLMSDEEESIPIIEKKLSLASENNPQKILNILSQFYFKKQDYNQAFKMKKKWSSFDKIDYEEWLDFGNELRKEKQYKYSIDAYNFILKKNPNINVSGRAMLGLANTFENQIILDQEKHIIPYFFDNNIFFEDPFQVFSSISKENLISSLEIYDSLLVTLNKSTLLSRAYYKLGEIQYRIIQDFDQAFSLFHDAKNNNPKKELQIKTILRIADVLIAKGQLEEALEFLQIHKKINPTNKIEMKEILVCFLSGDFDLTLDKVDIALLTIYPSNPFFNDLIELKNIISKYKSSDKDDTIAFSHFLKAELYLRKNKLGDAIKELLYITNNYKNTKIVPLVNLRLGLLHYRIKDYNNALKFISFLENTDLSDKAIILAGQIHELKFFDNEKALSFYIKILDKNPKSIYFEPMRYHIRNLQNIKS